VVKFFFCKIPFFPRRIVLVRVIFPKLPLILIQIDVTLKRNPCKRTNAPPNNRKNPDAPFFRSTKNANVFANNKLLCQCKAIFKLVANILVAKGISGV